ncbi:hypothetical protein DPEC_G00182540 [Dallia pectoralis]|uniref:Uncharacterized protein n=1 Tax=Dallia pectoralis TaxID=75939 RepID=A0ACC2GAI9_DALPE|nr:hypothetical protein DPEC_G00182540 [Dallia pectoralis]
MTCPHWGTCPIRMKMMTGEEPVKECAVPGWLLPRRRNAPRGPRWTWLTRERANGTARKKVPDCGKLGAAGATTADGERLEEMESSVTSEAGSERGGTEDQEAAERAQLDGVSPRRNGSCK